MKKIVAVFMILITLIFVGCSKGENAETTEPQTTLSPTVTVTFPEGYSAVQIAKKLEKSDVCSAEDFLSEVNNIESLNGIYDFVSEIESENRPFALEGYIFPDTYEFYRGESAQSVLSRFLKNMQNKLTDEYKKRAKQLGYSIDEIITLASIIQKEAGMKEQMPKVSSVLHNRLKSPSFPRIQCDVTINYLNDYVVDSPYLTGSTERFKELYNTYKCTGLPEGAICNPGAQAIEAALYPEDTDYYYFVTDKEENYYYASTYEEHKKNCKICGLEG